MGTGQGLYLTDPRPDGNPFGPPRSVDGMVTVTYQHPSGGSTGFGLPAGTIVTLNGTRLRGPFGGNGLLFDVDPAGPQPLVAPGTPITLVAMLPAAQGTPAVTRTLVLPCPSDIGVTSIPAVGGSLAGAASVHVTSTANLLFNVGVPLAATLLPAPSAALWDFNATTQAFATQVSAPSNAVGNLLSAVNAAGTVDFTTAVNPIPAGDTYEMTLKWAGQLVVDGNSAGACGIVKHWTYAT